MIRRTGAHVHGLKSVPAPDLAVEIGIPVAVAAASAYAASGGKAASWARKDEACVGQIDTRDPAGKVLTTKDKETAIQAP
jgi:hypothetical protein